MLFFSSQKLTGQHPLGRVLSASSGVKTTVKDCQPQSPLFLLRGVILIPMPDDIALPGGDFIPLFA